MATDELYPRRALPVGATPARLAVVALCSSVVSVPWSITAFLRVGMPSPSNGVEKGSRCV